MHTIPRFPMLHAVGGAHAVCGALALAGALSILPAHVAAQPSHGRDEIRPRPFPGSGVTTSTEVEARLDGSILQVHVSQMFKNHGGRVEEVEILLPVPPDAVVTDGLLLADGQEIRAEVMDAQEARAIYEEIVRSRRDPALIELVGHGLLRLSAFPIPAGGTRTVSFQTHQSIPATEGRTHILLPLAALCGIDREGPLSVELRVEGSDPITQIYSPSHDLEIDREGRDRARLLFETDRMITGEKLEVIVVRDARRIGVDLRTARGRHGEDDYFLLAVSPGWDLLEERRKRPETKIFVLDTSGSMEGEKFEQAREALGAFLEELSPRDRFNLIAFSDRVRPLFRGEPRTATGEARREAQRWLDRLRASGGTAIASAVEEATRRDWDADIVLFLTDGLPTVGETDAGEILRLANRAPRGQRFYAFGVGYDVDARLLDQLAEQRGGSVSYVKPDEDVREAVAALVRRVEHPAARDVELAVRGATVREVYPNGPRDLFAGEPLLFAGRVDRRAGQATLRLTATGPGGERLTETWRVDFSDDDLRSSAVPVLWASRKAGDLIAKIHRDGPDRRTMAELREISERYGILNEEFSLLAREDEPLLADRRAPQGRLDSNAPFQVQDQFSARGNGATPPPSPTVGRGGRDAGTFSRLAAPKEQDATAQPLSPGKKAEAAGAADAFEVSAESWRLKEAKSAAGVGAEKDESAGVRTVGAVQFRREGDTWVDERLLTADVRHREIVKIRPFGPAYFKLVSDSPEIAEWFKLGERIRVALDGMILELAPDGSDRLDQATMRKLVDTAARD
jgi:Ca-activated chloride channel family protein